MKADTHRRPEVATKVTQILQRPNGTQVKIVAETMYGAGLHPSVDVTVFKRPAADAPWHLCNDRPAPNWREMSVDEYVRHGRSEKFQAVTHGEIFKVAALLGRPLTEF